MNKKLLQLGVIISLFIMFFSCKRSENDPFLSLRSRDKRLIGTWELNKMDTYSYYKAIYYNEYDTSTYERTCTSSFSGNTYLSSCVDQDGDVNADTATYSQTITINKDGTFVEKITSDEESYEFSGLWTWTNNTKNKVAIQLFNYYLDIYKSDDDASQFFYIDKLSDKELILKQEDNGQYYSNDGSQNKSTYSATYIFHKKKNK